MRTAKVSKRASMELKLVVNEKTQVMVRSLTYATIAIFIAAVGLRFSGGPEATNIGRRIFILLGGDIIGGGYIQYFTYIAFFWALIETRSKYKKIIYEKEAFEFNLLPKNEKHLLLPQDLVDLNTKISEFESKKNKYLLTDLIKKACIKFRANNSIPEVIDIISIQIDVNRDKAEGDQSTIRYLAWVIPSLGFIGTVLGISQALSIADGGAMSEITRTLGVAFDTTLISLILSIVIMWLIHGLQEENDIYHASLKEYVITNLVNRIEL